jgi:hypothetical protein
MDYHPLNGSLKNFQIVQRRQPSLVLKCIYAIVAIFYIFFKHILTSKILFLYQRRIGHTLLGVNEKDVLGGYATI